MNSQTTTLVDAAKAAGLKMTLVYKGTKVATDGWKHHAYSCYVESAKVSHPIMQGTYSAGMGHEADAATCNDVWESLASDIQSIGNHSDWLDWAEESGFSGADELRLARESFGEIQAWIEALNDTAPEFLETLRTYEEE